MPIYEYICKKCNTIFDISGSFTALSGLKAICPNCKSAQVQKKIFPVNIIYRGKGFTKARKTE